MGKTIMKRIPHILVMSALAILFFACPDELVQNQQDKAIVSFSVGDARTVLPQAPLDYVASYKLLGGINGEAEAELAEFTTGGTTISLSPGMWNFILNAYNDDDELILQGIAANKQINLTGTNQVRFSLSGVNSGMGAMRIILYFPVSAGITRISVNGDTDSEDIVITNSGTFVYSRDDVDAGDYFINFELYRGDTLRTVVSELVVVRNCLTSRKTITLVGNDLKPLPAYKIAIDLADINEWELTEQTARASANEITVFTVNGTYETYQWYLDGTLDDTLGETASSYIFDQPVGVYQLVVVVTNNGESRSGRCRITVAPPFAADVWVNGSLSSASDEDWYSFPVTSGTTYYIWWNDRKDGDGTKSGDVAVSARYADSSSWLLGGANTTADSGWTTYQSFYANQTGTVEIRVIPYNRGSANTGTYSIAYNTTGTRPATPYYIITFNANSGSGTTPTETVSQGLSVTLPNGSGLSRDGYSFGGWNTNSFGTGTNYDAGSLYTPTDDGTLYAKWISIPAPLSANVWADGNLTGTSEIRYSFSVSSGTTYYVWWNDSYEGNSTKTLNVKVSAQYSDGTAIFTDIDSAYTTARSFTASQDDTVYLMVSPYYPGYTGTYGIVYNTSGTRPTFYTVTFNANGGSGTPSAQSVSPGSGITLPSGSGLSKSGYIFGGWNTRSDGAGTNYASGSAYTPTGNVTLYARWIPTPLTANVWANGSLSSGTSEDWYSFSVTSGTTYRVWWNDWMGDKTKIAEVVVGARYAGSSSWIFGGTNSTVFSGWNTAQSFTANQTGTVEIRVIPAERSSNYIGTYGIVYSTSSTRPAL